MTDGLLLERLSLAAALALSFAGVVGVFAAPNLIKRLFCIVIAQLGALLAGAVLGAPGAALAAGVALLFAQVGVAAALIVRIQEAYGVVETPEIDAVDADDEAREPQP